MGLKVGQQTTALDTNNRDRVLKRILININPYNPLKEFFKSLLQISTYSPKEAINQVSELLVWRFSQDGTQSSFWISRFYGFARRLITGKSQSQKIITQARSNIFYAVLCIFLVATRPFRITKHDF